MTVTTYFLIGGFLALLLIFVCARYGLDDKIEEVMPLFINVPLMAFLFIILWPFMLFMIFGLSIIYGIVWFWESADKLYKKLVNKIRK